MTCLSCQVQNTVGLIQPSRQLHCTVLQSRPCMHENCLGMCRVTVLRRDGKRKRLWEEIAHKHVHYYYITNLSRRLHTSIAACINGQSAVNGNGANCWMLALS